MSALAGILGKLDKLAPMLSRASASGGAGPASLAKGLSSSMADELTVRQRRGLIQRGKAIEDVGEIGGRLRGAAQSSSGGFLGAGAGALRGVGEGAEMAGGAIGGALGGPVGAAIGDAAGKVVSAQLKMAAALLELPDKIRAWGNQLHEANMQFAQFSSSMAQVQAQTEVREFYLKRSQGEARAASAAYLAKGKGEVDKTMAPLENLWAKIENYISGGVMRLLAKILDPLAQLANLLGAGGGGSGDDGDIHSLLVDVAREEVKVRARRPPGMR